MYYRQKIQFLKLLRWKSLDRRHGKGRFPELNDLSLVKLPSHGTHDVLHLLLVLRPWDHRDVRVAQEPIESDLRVGLPAVVLPDLLHELEEGLGLPHEGLVVDARPGSAGKVVLVVLAREHPLSQWGVRHHRDSELRALLEDAVRLGHCAARVRFTESSPSVQPDPRQETMKKARMSVIQREWDGAVMEVGGLRL